MVFFQGQNLAADVDRDLRREVALGDGGGDAGDVAHLAGEVRRHRVHRVGEVLPGAGHARHHGLATELALGADLARHARDFRREAGELIDHRVDGFLQLENLALDVHRDLARQVAAGDGRGDGGDVAHLLGEVRRHRVDRVGEVLPRAGHAGHHGLTAQAPVGADLARHARHFRRERAQLIHHRVDGFLELQDLAADVHRDLLGQVAVGDGNRHVGDVADLRGEVAGHLVDRVGQLFPDARHALHLRLSTELAFGADLAGHARHLGGEDRELLDHRVDELCRAQELALELATVDLEIHRLPEVAARDGADGAGDLGCRPHEVVDERVERLGFGRPPAGGAGQRHALSQPAFLADRPAQTRDLAGDAPGVTDGLIEGLGDAGIGAGPVRWEADGEVAVAERQHGRQQLVGARLRAVVPLPAGGTVGNGSALDRWGDEARLLPGSWERGSVTHRRVL